MPPQESTQPSDPPAKFEKTRTTQAHHSFDIGEAVDENEFSLPRVLSRTKHLYNELQEKRKKLVEAVETARLSEGELPPLAKPASIYQENTIDEHDGPSTQQNVSRALGFIRAKNKWLRNAQRRKEQVDELIVDKLKRERQTFLTQINQLHRLSERTNRSVLPERRVTEPEKSPKKTHYFWSTQPSRASLADQKFQEFTKAKTIVTNAYKHTRTSIDRSSAKILYSAINRTPLTKKHPIADIHPTKVMARTDNTTAINSPKRITTFDASAFKTIATRASGLSAKVKAILKVDPQKRTENDVNTVNEAMCRLKCFDNLVQADPLTTAKIIKELSKTVVLEEYETRRTILKQGHIVVSFYFIVSGKVGLYKTHSDDKGLPYTTLNLTLSQGDTFGEDAFVRGTAQKRAVTVITMSDSEFLRVNKDTFSQVVLDTKATELNDRFIFLKEVFAGHNLSSKELQALNEAAKLETFEDSMIIVGNVAESPDYVQFIYRGECDIIRHIYLSKFKEPKPNCQLVNKGCHKPPSKYKIAELDDTNLVCCNGKRLAKPQLITQKLLVVGKLRQQHCFGAGEDLKNTYITAKGRVLCLSVPAAELITKPRLKTVLGKFRNKAQKLILTAEETFERYRKESQWKQYKQDMFKQLRLESKIKYIMSWPHHRILRDIDVK